MKKLFFLLALLNSVTAWGNDGDTFVAKSIEGIEITFTVISEAEKTCEVGTGEDYFSYSAAIDKNQTGVLTIPELANGYSVVAIGTNAFYTCREIEAIDMPKSVESIGKNAFHSCEKLKHISFHEGLKKIGYEAFVGCGMTSIDLPKSLESIGYGAFTYMKLASVTVRSSAPIPGEKIFDYRIFYQTHLRATLYVPEGTINNFKTDDEWGKFRKIKEGEPLSEHPTDIAYPEDFGAQCAVWGKPVTFNVNFINERTTPISTISYVLVVDGVEGEEQTYEFPQSIAADGEPFTLPVTLPDFDEPIFKYNNVIIDVTKMNGVPVDYGADIRPNALGTVGVFIPVSDHKVLIRDFTHPKCLWALRSNVGFEKLKEKFGDKVIRTSVHLPGGPMYCDIFMYIPFTPTCVVDEKGSEGGLIDPYMGYYGENSSPLGIIDIVEEQMNRPHHGQVKILSAQWADADSTEINIVTETTFGMTFKPVIDFHTFYQIVFTLVEDGLKGNGSEWEQLNGYSGMTTDDPNLQPLTQLPYTITDMVYNDVVVGEFQEYIGDFRQHHIAGQPIICGEPWQQTYTLRLSKLRKNIIQDKSRLSVVACLQDRFNNDRWTWADPVDSDKSPIAAFSSGVQNIMQSAAPPHDVYDLSGRKVRSAAKNLDNLPKGIYIYGGKKIVIDR